MTSEIQTPTTLSIEENLRDMLEQMKFRVSDLESLPDESHHGNAEAAIRLNQHEAMFKREIIHNIERILEGRYWHSYMRKFLQTSDGGDDDDDTSDGGGDDNS